ncbi:MAG: CHC2 zinc finger domain-containing protein [Desulfuromonadales bacterium]
MTVLDLALAAIPGLKKKTAKEWAGPCPACGGNDRFLVWVHRDAWHCRGCNESGDAVAFLRKFDGKSCPESHTILGKDCDSSSCPVADRCRQGGKQRQRPKPAVKPLHAPAPEAPSPAFAPTEATPPAELWRAQADKLIARAHAALLENPEQLAYLAARGLPRAAVERYRLGWLAEDLYRPRAAWGLPPSLRDDGKPKKLWLPAGIVIPFFDADDHPDRIRIRRPRVKEGECRYYWVPGSGDDVPVLGADARAFAVVESDLDAFLVHWHAGDLVGAIPLGTCSAKPKEAALAALRGALAILVSLDHEPRHNQKTGCHENPGGQASRWWCEQFPRAKRWPTPAGKDPGEFFQDHGGDIRAWVLSGLPPVFRVTAAPPVNTVPAAAVMAAPVAAPVMPAVPEVKSEPVGDHGIQGYLRGVSAQGIPFIVAETPEILARVRAVYPDEVPFLRSEIRHLQGFSPADAHSLLLVKQAFPEALILGSRALAETVGEIAAVYNPARQRLARAQQRGDLR